MQPLALQSIAAGTISDTPDPDLLVDQTKMPPRTSGKM
ncbi:hypothetical protein BJG92_03438 [Arthrobacter sp. SO5]|nr:hypothetical protein [Arthrobacter sp. SO5]